MNSKDKILQRFRKGPKDRAQFVASHVDKGIAYQIRALRDRQELSQEELAEMVGMNQNAISRLESPERGRPTITTLKRLAEAFDVGLVVRFVPHSQVADWVSGTPFIDSGISTQALAPPNFDEEEEMGAFTNQISAQHLIPSGGPLYVNRQDFNIWEYLAPTPNVLYIGKTTAPVNVAANLGGLLLTQQKDQERVD